MAVAMVIDIASTTSAVSSAPAVVALVLLAGFLIAKEIAISKTDRGATINARILDVVLIPLLFVGGAIIAAEIVF